MRWENKNTCRWLVLLVISVPKIFLNRQFYFNLSSKTWSHVFFGTQCTSVHSGELTPESCISDDQCDRIERPFKFQHIPRCSANPPHGMTIDNDMLKYSSDKKKMLIRGVTAPTSRKEHYTFYMARHNYRTP